MANYCCICGLTGLGQALMVDRASGVAFCPEHTQYFDTMREPDGGTTPCPQCGFIFNGIYSLFLDCAHPLCPVCQGSLKAFAKTRPSADFSRSVTESIKAATFAITTVDEIHTYAEAVIQQLDPSSGIDFGYNGHSCEFIENYLLAFFEPEKEALAQDYSKEYSLPDPDLIKGVGSFLGECMVQCGNGQWTRSERDGWAIRVARGNRAGCLAGRAFADRDRHHTRTHK